MGKKKTNWTDQQRRAITARGSDVLVAASAGTGKTAVLSGRCVDIVSDQSICPDVWSILVLTFTDAAAEQMRSRIAEQLRAAFLKSRTPHLRRQLMLLQGADISTIHSFCKRLITEYFYKLGLDPTFSVIDSDEAKLLKAEALEKTLNWAWQQSNLQQALRQLLYRRDPRTSNGFLAKVTELSGFLDGIVSRQGWYDRAAYLAEAGNPLATDLAESQKQIIAGRLQDISCMLHHAEKLYGAYGGKDAWLGNLKSTLIEPIQRCSEVLKAGNLDKLAEELRNFDRPRLSKPKELPEMIAELIHGTMKHAVDCLAELTELAVLNPDYLEKVSSSAGLQTSVLVELLKKFDSLYSKAKRAINCLDFADLEHYALKLLTEQTSSDDNLVPSDTALALRRRYEYIFVDEYQDINPVQQAILDMLSSDDNDFFVGDVKQSIYAFRGAEPEIFVQSLKSASADPVTALKGLRIDLNMNFRSAKGILDFVNKVFSRLMTGSQLAGIDYDELAMLRPAQEYERAAGDSGSGVVEFHILNEANSQMLSQANQTSNPDDEILGVVSSRQREAAMIARRIRQMVGSETGKPEFKIYDKDEDRYRDVEYRDIVILMRSLAKKANDYVEVLRLAGIPVSCQSSAGYFETTEINDLIALLRVLDNPQRDIELAAVLRSPLFGVSDTDLAKVRAHSRSDQQCRNFCDCVLRYCTSGPDVGLSEKLQQVLAQIEQWRTLARQGNLADLIWQIYRETGFLSFVSAQPSGQARRANLLKLHDRAIQFEGFASSAGFPSLTRFVGFIEKVQEAGQDWAPAEPAAVAGNAVRILSAHKSKGLEFPVVFLAELASRFNKKDSQDDCLAHAEDTLGLRIIDRDSNSKLSSLAHQVIAEKKLSKALAEEMRILYVATTRARERLILTASAKRNHCRAVISNGFFFGAGSIPDWQLRRCQSHLDWILYGLSDQRNLHSTFDTGLAARTEDDGLFGCKLYDHAQLKQLSHFVLKLKADKSTRTRPRTSRVRQKQKESKLLSLVKSSLAWRYGFGDAPLLPAKTSVTELTHRSDEYAKFDYSRVFERQPIAAARLEAGFPRAADAALIGSATHLVISQLELAKPVTREAVEQIRQKLLREGAISETVAELIDVESIVAFFQTELGEKVLGAASCVLREWPFTFSLPACEFPSGSSHEQRATSDEVTVIQGIIDMLVHTPQGLIVIDFKTDQVNADQVDERAGLYRRQLELYGKAASAILRAESVAEWLYFLTPGCAVEV